ncbi:unnamed protein product [Caenorhabditis angaria]|uniref:G-protein coupled receptors family 1 profile domain-containing protein n=1 Tax=Caenorhabditis angaria TaxID=860376 RepID=A0A9P1IYC9_9PELO|nr:unnamed protein product [Caenorhabditis angaria]
MYIHWSHHYLPKLFGGLSFIFNPLFMYLIVTEKKTNIGNYRFLLMFFAIFDMIYSLVELLVPVAIHGTGYAFIIYLTDGPFIGNLRFGQLAVSVRCGFIALSYGILAVHFIYRYIALFNPKYLPEILRPIGMCCIFTFFIAHGIAWSTICETFLYLDNEIAEYIHEPFMRIYECNSHNLSMLIALYNDGSDSIRLRSWAGILILTGISIYAISLYIILGTKIALKLRDNPALSKITKTMHKQLFKALAVQTIIPICISFAPCLAAWYAPALHLDFGKWNNYLGVIALSAFPFMDPLAIILLLPNYRNRIFPNSSKTIRQCTTTMASMTSRAYLSQFTASVNYVV